jgi:hypothetical protein
MSVRKAKARTRTNAAAKKPLTKKSPTGKSTPKKKKGKDIVEVRENINELVKDSAEDIATSVIEVATRTGQLASAKYLFEAVGLYPATEQTLPPPVVGSLAHTLLQRMGLPTEPVVSDEEEAAVAVASNVKGYAREAASETANESDKDAAITLNGEQEPGVEKVEGEPAE